MHLTQQLIRVIFFIILIAVSPKAIAQTDSNSSPLKISGYAEVYFGYDFAKPADHTRPSFVYAFNRTNEVNLNLGFIKAAYEKKYVRANLALMTGTYANANYTSEPGVLKNLFEANAGIKISKTKSLWIDAGIFPSHIGFEGAVGKYFPTLTRSILADNSPYYESGVKISYSSDNEKWFLSGLYLNGWQRIQRLNGNNTPAFGHQITFTPNKKITLNNSTFVGSDTPDSNRLMRYFHDFYGQFELFKKLNVTLGFDIGAQQKTKGSSHYNIWYAPIIIVDYQITKKLSIAARTEYYSDRNQVIIYTGTPNGFQTMGYSLTFDYAIRDNVVWRIEGKKYESKDAIFILDNNASHHNYCATTSLGISF